MSQQCFGLFRWSLLIVAIVLSSMVTAHADLSQTVVQSPDGRNVIVLQAAGEDEHVRFTVRRDGKQLIRPSLIGPLLATGGSLGKGAFVVDVRHGKIKESFSLPWGKTSTVANHCSYAVVTLQTRSKIRWEIELRAYDDGVAFRYELPLQEGLSDFEIRDEVTQYDVAGDPTALFNTLDSFTTSHESLYERKPISEIPVRKLLDMPLLLIWPDGHVAAITEARVREFAGAYLRRPSVDATALRCQLSPLPSRDGVCVVGKTPHSSPWRVILQADEAGQLLESNLLQCLNDPPIGNFSWLHPGKSSFHWWYGAFEDDFKLPVESSVYYERHRAYIDFCAQNNIAYHAVSGDGQAWYKQSKTDYGTAVSDADILTARPEIELPKILAYARERGVGIRLWVHWKPLSQQLEEAFALYESWGIKGLMVDFLDRDDQEMIAFTERMLGCAARHKLHIQIHGSSKFSGEQRTFPHLFNREGVLNLEYLKWSNLCTPDHSVNVAYTRALAGPVDYHLGGLRSVSRAEFQSSDRAPTVMGTRCHNLALYVVFENPMPLVADAPSAYKDQTGFDFITEVPTTWDETRFLVGNPGEYVVVARRKAEVWYVGGITNWTSRKINVPTDFLKRGEYEAKLYVDGSMDESRPNDITPQRLRVSSAAPLKVSMAPGGGFVAILHAK